MSNSCPYYSQNCSQGCCDVYGSCPLYYSDCYSYYTTNTSTSTVPTGIIVGAICGVVGFIVLISLLVWCNRRRMMQRALRNQAMLNQTGMMQNMTGMNMMNMQPNFNPMMQQPPMMQPMMGTPFGMNNGPIGQPMGY